MAADPLQLWCQRGLLGKAWIADHIERVAVGAWGQFRKIFRRYAPGARALVIVLAADLASAPASFAACGNPVACENALPGDAPSDWQVAGAGDSTIQGYATSMGVSVGQTESFKIKTPSTKYHLDILRLGYYGGDGARMIASNLKAFRHVAPDPA